MTDRYDYDAFGNLVNSMGSTPNNYLFAGEQYDSALGFYYNRSRYVNTVIGRFMTLDHDDSDIGDPRSLHLYLYAAADPVNHIDPSGNDTLEDVQFNLAILLTLAVMTTQALLVNTHAQSRFEIPIRANHYTQWAFLLSILETGLNRPTNYVTTDWYLWASEAKKKLALPEKPQVLINFFVYKNEDGLLGPNPVDPAFREPGGGTEYSTSLPIPVSTRSAAVVPLFTN